MAMSAGMVVGTMAYERLVVWMTRRSLVVAAVVGASAALVGMALLPPFALLVVFAAAAGLLWGPTGPLANHAMRTPDHLRGRLMVARGLTPGTRLRSEPHGTRTGRDVAQVVTASGRAVTRRAGQPRAKGVELEATPLTSQQCTQWTTPRRLLVRAEGTALRRVAVAGVSVPARQVRNAEPLCTALPWRPSSAPTVALIRHLRETSASTCRIWHVVQR